MHKCDGCRYKGEYHEMMFRPVPVCNRGANLLEGIKNYEAEKCPYQKTNADRIRAMSDEELAEKLYCFTDIDCKIPYCKNLAECEKMLDTEDGVPVEKCKRCLLEWLQKPAEAKQ